MHNRMKTLFLFLLLLLSGLTAKGQCKLMADAEKILQSNNPNFEEAVQKLLGARLRCQPLTDEQSSKLNTLTTDALTRWQKVLSAARRETEKKTIALGQSEKNLKVKTDEVNRLSQETERLNQQARQLLKETEENRRVILSGVLASAANAERKNGNATGAFALAYEGFALAADDPLPAVKQAFGNAVIAEKRFPLKLDTGITQSGFVDADRKFFLISLDNNGYLYNLQGGFEGTLELHDQLIFATSVSSTGRYLLTMSRDGTAGLWDVSESPVKSTHLKMDGMSISAGVFAPGEDFVWTGTHDGNIIKWNLRTGSSQLLPKVHQEAVVGFEAAQDHVLSRSYGKVAVIDWATGTVVNTNPIDHGGALIYTASFSPSEQQLVTASSDNTAKVWNVDGSLRHTLQHDDILAYAAYSHKGDRLITCGRDRKAIIWGANGQQIMPLEGHEGTVRFALFTKEDQEVITKGTDARLIRWSDDFRYKTVFGKHEGKISTLLVSPNEDFIVSASDGNQSVRMWDFAGNEWFEEPDLQGPRAAISKDGSYILMTSRDGEDGNAILCPTPMKALSDIKAGDLPPKITDDLIEKYSLEGLENGN